MELLNGLVVWFLRHMGGDAGQVKQGEPGTHTTPHFPAPEPISLIHVPGTWTCAAIFAF